MSALGQTNATLLDLIKRLDPSQKNIARIIEILNQTNEVLDDMTWVEANGLTSHRTTVRSALPTPTYRALNAGVTPTKSRTAQVDDVFCSLEAYSEIDADLLKLNGDSPEFRLSEDVAHIEGMNQSFASSLFYANAATAPTKFTGLAPRYATISGAENARNILTGGGSGNVNTSVWLVCWGTVTAHGIYPKGIPAGLSMEDKGKVTVESANGDGTGGRLEAYRTHYAWKCGLSVRDWRYVVRIPNIDVTALTKGATTGADLIDLMAQAIEVLPTTKLGKPVFYCNSTVKSFLRRQVANKVASNLNLDTAMGKTVMSFDGIPVRRCDALLSTEATVS
jgi:hypothetical protein